MNPIHRYLTPPCLAGSFSAISMACMKWSSPLFAATALGTVFVCSSIALSFTRLGLSENLLKDRAFVKDINKRIAESVTLKQKFEQKLQNESLRLGENRIALERKRREIPSTPEGRVDWDAETSSLEKKVIETEQEIEWINRFLPGVEENLVKWRTDLPIVEGYVSDYRRWLREAMEEPLTLIPLSTMAGIAASIIPSYLNASIRGTALIGTCSYLLGKRAFEYFNGI